MKIQWMGAGALVAVVGLAVSAPAAEPTAWVHVRVDEAGNDEGRVSVNLPLSVVRAALKLAPEKIVHDGHVRIPHHGDHDLDVSDLRALWAGLLEAGDAEFVTVENADETVRIARSGDNVHVFVDGSDGEKVKVDVPLKLVDALLGTEGDELDVAAAVEHLSGMRGDIVTVSSDDAQVRVWIDDGAGD
jgi:hypothetical protein